jgi:hypothetical protein
MPAVTEPTPLVAHRCLVWAGRADGTTYEISRALGTAEEELDETERRVALTWTPVEARRLSTYLVGMGWHDVRTEKIALAELAEHRRQLAAQSADEARPEIKFAAPGGLTCRAVAAPPPDGI